MENKPFANKIKSLPNDSGFREKPHEDLWRIPVIKWAAKADCTPASKNPQKTWKNMLRTARCHWERKLYRTKKPVYSVILLRRK